MKPVKRPMRIRLFISATFGGKKGGIARQFTVVKTITFPSIPETALMLSVYTQAVMPPLTKKRGVKP